LAVGSKKGKKFPAVCTGNLVKLEIVFTFALRLSETQDAAMQLAGCAQTGHKAYISYGSSTILPRSGETSSLSSRNGK
jgi:hypothetical protein